MTVVWRYLGANGQEVGSSEPFADQESAEAWLGEAWLDLRDRGIHEVELVEGLDGAVLYRMSLLGVRPDID
jgi:hypothetical protein